MMGPGPAGMAPPPGGMAPGGMAPPPGAMAPAPAAGMASGEDAETAAKRKWLEEKENGGGAPAAPPPPAAPVDVGPTAGTCDGLSDAALMHLCLNGNPQDAENAEGEIDRRSGDMSKPAALPISQDGMDKLAAAGIQ